MNQVILIGNLGKDPELKMMPNSDKAVCNFSIAVKRPFAKDKSDWHNIVVWGKTAENCSNYLTKGSKVAVVGYVTNRSWGEEGNKKFITEVVANEVEFLSSVQKSDFNPAAPVDSEDIPF